MLQASACGLVRTPELGTHKPRTASCTHRGETLTHILSCRAATPTTRAWTTLDDHAPRASSSSQRPTVHCACVRGREPLPLHDFRIRADFVFGWPFPLLARICRRVRPLEPSSPTKLVLLSTLRLSSPPTLGCNIEWNLFSANGRMSSSAQRGLCFYLPKIILVAMYVGVSTSMFVQFGRLPVCAAHAACLSLRTHSWTRCVE